MTFYTGVDAPGCNRLKSTMQKATEKYDRRVLRRLNLTGSANRVRREAGGVQKRLRAGEPLPPPVETRKPASSREPEVLRRASASAPLYDRSARNPEVFQPDGEMGPREPEARRPVSEWLEESLHLLHQAQGHSTFTHDLRKQSSGLKKVTDAKTQKSRLATNTELRGKVRDVNKKKMQLENALNGLMEEQKQMSQVRQFIIELRAMLESGAVAGVQMREGLRDSRPQSERTEDAVDTALEEEAAHHRSSSDHLSMSIDDSEELLRDMVSVTTDLFAHLEDMVEGLRVDEQCLVLDGSSSINIHMGGTADKQPPLDIMLDSKSREIIQGLSSSSSSSRSNPLPPQGKLVDLAKGLVVKSLSMRAAAKRLLHDRDMAGRKLNEKVEKALRFKVKMQKKLVTNLESRIACLQEERGHLDEQMETIRTALHAKNKEKDIVCKRLRLQCQLTSRDPRSKVHSALVKEYDVLTKAVQDYTSKLSHLILEISRMHDSIKALEESLSFKKTALAIDEKCLDLPFLHQTPWPQQIYNSICSGYSAVYGVAG